ncbi:transaldolase [Pantoea sp. Aalb]|uniref:transaldolase n=1 Tax=Pantoea sp. Aalb TaxID=2576762 RepID=UPI001323CF35|nr:transaldolase [Pantoea sp. Aalb]MXP67276.1 transaldolase [Pantoea sp. Aalb]
MNQLDALRQFSTVVADSGDIESIRHYHPEDATTNPSLILKAANFHAYKYLINDAIQYAKRQGGNKETQTINASDKVAVNIGMEILKNIPGRVSTEIDARLSFDRNMCIIKAEKLISMYEEYGINRSRILIKLASTWEGIKAAEELQKKEIQCNLTLLFSFAQARACAEANVYLISPFVGRIYDWYNMRQPLEPYDVDKDWGVKSIHRIYNYYKKYRYNTIIMGASFRKIEQILALAGCDKLTISPKLLQELANNHIPVIRKLMPSIECFHRPLSPLSQAEFYWEHNQDSMAVEKLSDGIRQFAIDQKKLEDMLANYLFN